MPIYTRTGDKGKTSLFDGTRVLKSHQRVDAYGTIDELNSAIGVVIAQIKAAKGKLEVYQTNVKKELENIQHDLLDIGSYLAHPNSQPILDLEKRPKDFEHIIDFLTAKMPELKEFILPGGSPTGAHLHMARTISRRVERKLVGLMQKEEIDETVVKYINRLSDLFFTMARYVNFREKHKDVKWRRK